MQGKHSNKLCAEAVEVHIQNSKVSVAESSPSSRMEYLKNTGLRAGSCSWAGVRQTEVSLCTCISETSMSLLLKTRNSK